MNISPRADHSERATGTVARLSIRAAAVEPERAWSRLRAWWHEHLAPSWSAAVEVVVDDVHGHRVCDMARGRLPVDLPLPPGTYHVSVRRLTKQRRYTVTLASGATFDLPVRLSNGA